MRARARRVVPRFTSTISYDDGYATIAALGIIIAVVAVLMVVAGLFSKVAARHEAQVAADLAAIAAATEHAKGAEDPCMQAREVARLNNATVLRCTPTGRDVVVSAVVRGQSAMARAGQL